MVMGRLGEEGGMTRRMDLTEREERVKGWGLAVWW